MPKPPLACRTSSLDGHPGILIAAFLCVFQAQVAAGECTGRWSDRFSAPGMSGSVSCLTEFDDGRGPGIFVGGSFLTAGDKIVNRIARWDGAEWSKVGSGVSGIVFTLFTYDDGGGTELYAGGQFDRAGEVTANNIARWNGARWEPVGQGMDGAVRALEAYDDETGVALYAAGSFTQADGRTANRIARWSGTQWEEVGGGFNATVNTLAVKTLFPREQLCAGGSFSRAGGQDVSQVAAWDGTEWRDLAGVDGTVYSLRTITGAYSGLYAAGSFTHASYSDVDGLARIQVGQWFDLWFYPNDTVRDVERFTYGSTTSLFVVGDFRYMSDARAITYLHYIAEQESNHWRPVGGGLENTASVVESLDDGTGEALYVGGSFVRAGTIGASRIAKWDGSSWSSVGTGHGLAGSDYNTTVFKVLATEGDLEPVIYAAGDFTAAGAAPVHNIARWDGTEWTSLGDAVFGRGPNVPGWTYRVYDMAWFDDGSGTALYVAGNFGSVNDVGVGNIARWNGSEWASLGAGLSYRAKALAVFDDGRGDALYVGGDFVEAGGAPAARVARWNGLQWEALSGGLNGTVEALTVFDDGTAPGLYAGGAFTEADGQPAAHIARWDGAAWTPLSTGTDGPILTLAVFDDRRGPALYAGGSFSFAGEASAQQVARWDGQDWEALGGGTSGVVHELTVHEDACGKALYVAGRFDEAGGLKVQGFARWNGRRWHSLAAGDEHRYTVYTLASVDEQDGTALYLGGKFPALESTASSLIARWECVVDDTDAGDCDGNGAVELTDAAAFVTCVTGPAQLADASCDCSDVDCDGGVDLRDFAYLQRSYDGP